MGMKRCKGCCSQLPAQLPSLGQRVCTHVHALPADSVAHCWEGSADGRAWTLSCAHRKEEPLRPACWIASKMLWQLDSPMYRGWGKQERVTKNVTGLQARVELRPTSMNTGLLQEAGTALLHLPPLLGTEVSNNMNKTPYGHCNLTNASSAPFGEGTVCLKPRSSCCLLPKKPFFILKPLLQPSNSAFAL